MSSVVCVKFSKLSTFPSGSNAPGSSQTAPDASPHASPGAQPRKESCNDGKPSGAARALPSPLARFTAGFFRAIKSEETAAQRQHPAAFRKAWPGCRQACEGFRHAVVRPEFLRNFSAASRRSVFQSTAGLSPPADSVPADGNRVDCPSRNDGWGAGKFARHSLRWESP
jgi:hypothetical protein